MKNPVLFVGGSGVVGRHAVALFRERHPDLPLLIGARDLEKANVVAKAIGNAQAISIDTGKPRLGVGLDVSISAVVMITADDGLHGLRFAQDLRVPYLSIGNWLVEIGGETAHFARRPDACPIVLASHWHGGPALFLALATAKTLDVVRSIKVGAVLDTLDPTGPAAVEDMARGSEGVNGALAYVRGRRHWLSGSSASRIIHAIDGRALEATAIAPYDITGLHAATGAEEVRLDLAIDVSSSRLRGGPISTEVILEMEGDVGGNAVVRRSSLEFTKGQAMLTSLSIVLALSTVLGLEGRAPASPGLYFPEQIMDAEWFLNELAKAGATVVVSSERPLQPSGEECSLD